MEVSLEARFGNFEMKNYSNWLCKWTLTLTSPSEETPRVAANTNKKMQTSLQENVLRHQTALPVFQAAFKNCIACVGVFGQICSSHSQCHGRVWQSILLHKLGADEGHQISLSPGIPILDDGNRALDGGSGMGGQAWCCPHCPGTKLWHLRWWGKNRPGWCELLCTKPNQPGVSNVRACDSQTSGTVMAMMEACVAQDWNLLPWTEIFASGICQPPLQKQILSEAVSRR